MSKFTVFLSVTVLAILFMLAAPTKSVQATSVDLPNQVAFSDLRFKTDELIVGLKLGELGTLDASTLSASNLGDASLTALASKFGVTKISQVFSFSADDKLASADNLQGVFSFQVKPGTNLRDMRDEFGKNPYVEYTEYDRLLYASDVTPNDPLFPTQWGLYNARDFDIDVKQAWDIQTGQSTTLIAIIDTGVLYTHPDLAGARIRTDIDHDFVNNDDDAIDDNGHGTHVAGIIGANTNNGLGISGICMGCSILPIKVLDNGGSGTAKNVAKGITYAADHGANIINMSLGLNPNCGCSKTIAKAVNYAFKRNVLLIAASGNDGKAKLSYPASSSRVMAVGSINFHNKRSDFSNFGKGLDLVAPGEDIMSTYLNDDYKKLSGTSMAAPHVVGVAGLIISGHPEYKNTQVWWILRHTATNVGARGYDQLYGFGRVNAFQAVTMVTPQQYMATVDKCNSEPSAGCSDCSMSMVADEADQASFAQNVETLYQFRDSVLAVTPTGKRWIAYFEAHTLEISGLLYADAALRKQAADVLTLWMPAIRVLAKGSADPYMITSNHIDQLRKLRDAFIAHGSKTLANDLQHEWERLKMDNRSNQETHAIWNLVNAGK